MTFAELEKKLKIDGWYYYDLIGRHIQYKHQIKSGRITIPKHRGSVKVQALNAILNQAKLK